MYYMLFTSSLYGMVIDFIFNLDFVLGRSPGHNENELFAICYLQIVFMAW